MQKFDVSKDSTLLNTIEFTNDSKFIVNFKTSPDFLYVYDISGDENELLWAVEFSIRMGKSIGKWFNYAVKGKYPVEKISIEKTFEFEHVIDEIVKLNNNLIEIERELENKKSELKQKMKSILCEKWISGQMSFDEFSKFASKI